MVLRMKRDFAGSNEVLEAAKAEMDRLYAASVTENVLSVMVNDSTVSYSGDNYERVLLHLYMALNYLELGSLIRQELKLAGGCQTARVCGKNSGCQTFGGCVHTLSDRADL